MTSKFFLGKHVLRESNFIRDDYLLCTTLKENAQQNYVLVCLIVISAYKHTSDEFIQTLYIYIHTHTHNILSCQARGKTHLPST